MMRPMLSSSRWEAGWADGGMGGGPKLCLAAVAVSVSVSVAVAAAKLSRRMSRCHIYAYVCVCLCVCVMHGWYRCVRLSLRAGFTGNDKSRGCRQ